jgi:hypothetical protein
MDLGQGSVAPGVVSLGTQPGDIRVGIFYSGGSPAFSLLIDGDPTPVVLSAGPAAGETWRDVELVFIFGGGTSLPSDGIGCSATAFASGIGINVRGTSFGPLSPRTNADFASICDATRVLNFTDPWSVTYTLKVAAVLDGDASDKIELTISEDATTLTSLEQATPVLRYRVVG